MNVEPASLTSQPPPGGPAGPPGVPPQGPGPGAPQDPAPGGYGPPPGGPAPGGYGPPPGGPAPGGYGPPPGGPAPGGPAPGGYGPPPGAPGGYGPPPPGGGYGPPGGGYGGGGPGPGGQGGWGGQGGQGGGGWGAPPPGGGWGGPPQGGWPQQQGGWPQQQGGWQQAPYGSPQYQQRAFRPMPPPKRGVGLVILGVFAGFFLFFVWLISAYPNLGVAAVSSAFLGGAAALVSLGIFRRIEKPAPAWMHLAVAAGVALLFTMTGPSASGAYYKSLESDAFAKLDGNSTPVAWKARYLKDIPEKFRRKGWELEYEKARIAQAKKTKDVVELRAVLAESKKKSDLSDAEDASAAALKELYDEGKAKMYAPPKSGSAPEFPVDNALREAFATVLDDLAKSPDPNIHVAFATTATLTEPEGATEMLALERKSASVLDSWPKGDVPVIAEGNAFGPQYDNRRRATFMEALGGAFAQVFDGKLLTLVPLEATGDKSGKLVIEVSSRIYRTPTFFHYTKTTGDKERVVGLLFSFDVEWDFKLIDREGKTLYKAPLAISSPSDARFQSQPSDPEWGVYSILMDSAYFNYSREVTGRFGLVPPPPKDYFRYQSP
ncbi:MAG: DUF308 domain-containing protein [Polyangiaceae bacterium]